MYRRFTLHRRFEYHKSGHLISNFVCPIFSEVVGCFFMLPMTIISLYHSLFLIFSTARTLLSEDEDEFCQGHDRDGADAIVEWARVRRLSCSNKNL